MSLPLPTHYAPYHFLKNEKDISQWLMFHEIKNFQIIKHKIYGFAVNVEGSVKLGAHNLSIIAVKFNIVSGDFFCELNSLTSLQGSPLSVGGHFDCGENLLTSLEHAPLEVSQDFWCHNNQLTYLEHAPKHVGGSFLCEQNRLTSLKGCPKIIKGTFSCSNNELSTLLGGPHSVDGNFICASNKLISLEGCPKKIKGGIFNDNEIENLVFFPEDFGRRIMFYGNKKLGKIEKIIDSEELYKEHIKHKAMLEKEKIEASLKNVENARPKTNLIKV